MFKNKQPLLKTTALHTWHLGHGARMDDYHGWWMPSRYRTGAEAEHRAVRTAAGLFDVSHLGLLVLRGKRSGHFLHYLLTGNVLSMKEFEVRFHLILNPLGGILDGVLLYRLPDYWFMSTSPSNAETVRFWLEEHQPAYGIDISDVTPEFSLLALQGPNSRAILELAVEREQDIPGRHMVRILRTGDTVCWVSRTGYTGEDGFEILVPKGDTQAVWEKLLAGAQSTGRTLLPTGMQARESLRFEAGLPEFGKEMNYSTSAAEAGLMRYCDMTKDFLGKQALERQLAGGLKVGLAVIELQEHRMPEQGAVIFNGDGNPIGNVASVAKIPGTGKCYCNGFIRSGSAGPGAQVGVLIGKRRRQGLILSEPLASGRGKRRTA